MDALVTCIYNGLSGTPFGGRLNRNAHYRESLATISQSGLPVVCFTPADELAGHQAYFASLPASCNIRFIPLELEDIPYSAEIQRIKASDPERYDDLPWQERCVQIMWGKFTMLEQALNLERCADNVYWIDAGLANANIISTRYISEEALAAERLCEVGQAFPPRLFARIRDYIGDRLLALRSTTPHQEGIPEKYNTRPYENRDGIVAGLLGGPRDQVRRLCGLFAEKTAALIQDRVLYFEESILTGIFADHPELFRVFTFDSWYHEGWECSNPDRTSFSQFFDLMLGSSPPEKILGFPYSATPRSPPSRAPNTHQETPAADNEVSRPEPPIGLALRSARQVASSPPRRTCFVTTIDSIEPFQWGLDIDRIGVPTVVFCTPEMADEVLGRAPSPLVTVVVQDVQHDMPPSGKLALLLQACQTGYQDADDYYWLDSGLLMRHLSFEYLYSAMVSQALAALPGETAHYLSTPGYDPSSFFGGPREVLSATAQQFLGGDEDTPRALFDTTFSNVAAPPLFRMAFNDSQLHDPNLYLAAAAITEPILHVIGDSHIYNCFTPNRLIGCRARVLMRTTDVSSVGVPYSYQLSHHLGGRTMFRAGRPGELPAVAEQCIVKDGDAVVWVFGEIDVRCHVVKRHEEDGIPLPEIIANLAGNFIRGIVDVQSRYQRLVNVVFAPIPPLDNPNYQSADFPVYGTIDQRIAARRQLCAELARLCEENGILFVDCAEHYQTAHGDLRWELSDMFCHIAPTYQGPAIDATYALLGAATAQK